MKELRLIIDNDVIDRYAKHYFNLHPKAKRRPIAHPYHPSINSWMIMRKPMLSAIKGKWKDFIVWFIKDQGYSNLHIEKCDMCFTTYYQTNRRHDVDNCTPKFILDGLAASGFIVDDDCVHLNCLTLQCFVDSNDPRTEIKVTIKGDAQWVKN